MANSADGIHIQLDGIGHLLQDRRLAVPTYQRSYAWSDKNVTQLFLDIATAIREQEKEYFLGSVVLIGGTDRPWVVDGQQRLATTTVLLAAIRDYFEAAGDSQRANAIESNYLLETDLRTQERTAKLKLNQTDNDFFFKRVLTRKASPDRKTKPGKESHERIADAARIAEKHIKSVAASTNDPSNFLIDWLEFISHKAQIIQIQVPDSANAFRIFETLNDRGLKLALSDLLKNFLFQQSGDRIEEAQNNWISMASVLEAVDDEDIILDFIRHLWASENGITREKELYDSIKKKVTSKQAAIDLSNRLSQTARTYAAIINTDSERWAQYGSETRAYMATLNMMGITQIRPLLLAILEKFAVMEVKRALRLFVSWAARFLIVGGVGGGTLENQYSDRATQVMKGEITTAASLLKEMKTVVPSDPEFEKEFASSTVSRAPLARYYLRVLERQNAGEEEPEFVPNPNEDEVTLEHILPQSPALNQWKGFDADTARASVKRIGNLALMKKRPNNNTPNLFADKVKEYAKSSFHLTKNISSFAVKSKWLPDSIDKRQLQMAKLAVKAWPNKIA